jgi:hypothetical protein
MISFLARSRRWPVVILLLALFAALTSASASDWFGVIGAADADFFRIFRCVLWPDLLCYLNV